MSNNLPSPNSRIGWYQRYLAGEGTLAELPEPVSDLDWYLWEQCVKKDIKKYRQITDHCMIYNALSDGVDTGVTFVHNYYAKSNCYDLKLVYGNFYIPNAEPIADTNTPNDITVKASIVVGTDIFPLKFNGSDSIVLKPGAIVETDTLGIELNKGDNFRIRTYVSVSAGEKFPTGMGVYFGGGEMKITGDVTVSGSASGGSAGFSYHPLAIIGVTATKSVLISGDSIFTNVTSGPDGCSIIGGYGGLALHNGDIPNGGIARNSDQVNYFLRPLLKQNRIKLAKYYDYVISDYSINDVTTGRSFASIQSDLLKLWNLYISRGLKVYQCTITPKTTSTDSFATTTNQTTAIQNPVRVQINDWIRTCPAPLSGIFDTADVAETSRNSGIWKVGLTTEGLHPSATTGHTTLATAIDVSLFK